MKSIAQILSWVFSPITLPILGLVIVMYTPSFQNVLNYECFYTLHPTYKLIILNWFFILTFLAPIVSLFFLKKGGVISTVEIDDKNERLYPIILMFVYCMFLFFFVSKAIEEAYFPKLVISLALSGSIITFIYIFINKWKKISIHGAGAGILVGFVLSYILILEEYSIWMLILPVMISGLVMSSRLYLQKHTLFEVVFGWLIGFIITLAVSIYY